MAAKVQTPEVENAPTDRLNSMLFIASSQGLLHYPAIYLSAILLHTSLTIPPIYKKAFWNKLILVQRISVFIIISHVSFFWGTELVFPVLSNKDKGKKYSYNPEAVSSLSIGIFQQKIVQSRYLLCLDLCIIVYNSQGRFLIFAAGRNGLPRISGLCQGERRMWSSVPFPCDEIVCISRFVQIWDFFCCCFLITREINPALSGHTSNPAEAISNSNSCLKVASYRES